VNPVLLHAGNPQVRHSPRTLFRHEENRNLRGCICVHSAADEDRQPGAPSSAFGDGISLKVQHVVQCSPEEITLVDIHQTSTHLEKDTSWPDCSVFQKDDVLDFYLSRGEKTRFLSYEKSEWWRKAM